MGTYQIKATKGQRHLFAAPIIRGAVNALYLRSVRVGCHGDDMVHRLLARLRVPYLEPAAFVRNATDRSNGAEQQRHERQAG
jgi:hypothetical protein